MAMICLSALGSSDFRRSAYSFRRRVRPGSRSSPRSRGVMNGFTSASIVLWPHWCTRRLRRRPGRSRVIDPRSRWPSTARSRTCRLFWSSIPCAVAFCCEAHEEDRPRRQRRGARLSPRRPRPAAHVVPRPRPEDAGHTSEAVALLPWFDRSRRRLRARGRHESRPFITLPYENATERRRRDGIPWRGRYERRPVSSELLAGAERSSRLTVDRTPRPSHAVICSAADVCDARARLPTRLWCVRASLRLRVLARRSPG